MNRMKIEKELDKMGLSLYKEDFYSAMDEINYKWKVAQNCNQYAGGDNTPKRFENLADVEEFISDYKIQNNVVLEEEKPYMYDEFKKR